MIKNIVTDPEVLSKKCELGLFTKEEQKINEIIIQDLFDTAQANKKNCVGLAANQINYNKRIVVILINDNFHSFINPVIMPLRTHGRKTWYESCLSFPGREQIKTKRWKKIKVKYQMKGGEIKECYLKGFQAAIMQHEMAHLEGFLV